jgi:hypothetical protein
MSRLLLFAVIVSFHSHVLNKALPFSCRGLCSQAPLVDEGGVLHHGQRGHPVTPIFRPKFTP